MTDPGTPFHSRHSTVHHAYDDCAVGRGIARAERLAGTGGKPLCGECARRADGKPAASYGHGASM